MDCRQVAFSAEKSQERIHKALQQTSTFSTKMARIFGHFGH